MSTSRSPDPVGSLAPGSSKSAKQSHLKRIAKLIRVLASNATRSAFMRYRVVAAVEHQPVLRFTRAATVVDIGANRGQFALAARTALPKARIVSFEPLPEPAQRYRKLFSGDNLTALHQCAIGVDQGEATIHVSTRDDSSSLLLITALQNEVCPGTAEKTTQTVKIGRLDNFLSQADLASPALLKLDVQGFELQALKGCEPLIACFDFIYVECSFLELYAEQALAHEVIEWLGSRGLILVGIYNVTYDRNDVSLQADFLFEQSRIAAC
jgi:FkbM family methyltransferase